MCVVKNNIHFSTGKSSISLEVIDLTSVISKDIYRNIYKAYASCTDSPISSSTCKRSFSATRRIKTWLRT